MRVDLPVTVMLRNKRLARVERTGADIVQPFGLFGRTADDSPELWLRDGHWHDDKTPSLFDIVATVTTDGEVIPLTNQFSRK